MMAQQFETIALIGIGLIGSSIARDIREKQLAGTIVVTTRSEATLKRAGELGLGDRYTLSAAEAVEGADLVVVSVPVGASGAVAAEIAAHLKPGAIVTDVGSTKGSVIAQMAPHLPKDVHFVPGHPIAGTEHSGPDAGFAGLFRGRWCILTPPAGTDEEAVARLRLFWETLGSMVDEMDPEHHDKVLAIVSHLPHIIAYNIVGTADDLETVTESEVIKTRPRASVTSPALPLRTRPCGATSACTTRTRSWKCSPASPRISPHCSARPLGRRHKLFDLFTRTRAIRRSIVQAGQDTAMPDFGRHAMDQK